jgi:hypothetical protein
MPARQSSLQLLKQEQLTVSTSEVGITTTLFDNDEATNPQPINMIKAVMTHDSGGKIYHVERFQSARETGNNKGTIDAVATVSNSGANGEISQIKGDKWEIIGEESIKAWVAIKDSGSSNALIQVALYGNLD